MATPLTFVTRTQINAKTVSTNVHKSHMHFVDEMVDPMSAQSCLSSATPLFSPSLIDFETTMIGFGQDSGTSLVDATEASVRAIQDALYRGLVSTIDVSSKDRFWRMAIKLGVPLQRSATSQPMQVDLVRVAAVVPSAFKVQTVTIEVGGLWVSGSDASARDTSSCAVVASVVIQQLDPTRETCSLKMGPSPRTTMMCQNRQLIAFLKPLPPPDELWTPPPHWQNSPMEMLVHVSEEVRAGMIQSKTIESDPKEFLNGVEEASSISKGEVTKSPALTTTHYRHQCAQKSYIDHVSETPTTADEALILPGGSYNLSFPIKLHQMLSEVQTDGYEHIISWQRHGRSFRIHNKGSFKETILPRYFNHMKRSSFFRQLNLYGFRRISAGSDKGAYYHELFLCSMRFLCRRMSRRTIRGRGVRRIECRKSDPNFNDMPSVPLATSVSAIASIDLDDSTCKSLTGATRVTPIWRSEASSNRMSFPLKLQLMLDNLEVEGKNDIISWLPDGRGFIVRDPDALVCELMPQYFRQTKYSSFQRQLHIYGFRRIKAGCDKGAFTHEHFQRDMPFKCRQIRRVGIKT